MKTLVKATSSVALTLLLSGCSFNNLTTPTKPSVDSTITVVENDSIKSISDITSIAFEWKRVDDPRVVGYNFYRANMHKDGRTLKLIKSLDNRYTTHFVDTNLEPDTKYIYQISSKTAKGTESKTTTAYMAKTLARITSISFAQAISDLPNRIKLVWRPHEDKRVEYYKVEKFNQTLNKWLPLKTLKSRLQAEYIDKNLDNNQTCKYRITAYTFNDIASAPSQIVSAKTKPLPIGVQSLQATNNLPKKIQLSWQGSPTQDVIKYAIFRSPFKTLGYTKQKTVDVNTLSYVDNIDEDGKDYYYKVYSIDKDALQSTDDIEPITGVTLNKPEKPIMTLAQIQDNKAILNWTAGDNRAISYNVYKKIQTGFFNSKTVKYTDIKDLRFEDNDILSGIEYKYSIQANDEYGLMSDKTDEAALILPKMNTSK